MHRRHFFALLLSTALSSSAGRRGLAGPLDQGIGGTGAAPPTEDADRGIGGTGVIGTIRKFGSIIVNDLRITYAPDVLVRIDGRAATVADLRIGQVVRVAASGTDGALSTRVIDVTSEVVGPVDRTDGKQLTVLGQRVVTTGLKTGSLKPGDIVAVSGLRRTDGTIVASLIERSPGAPSRVAGPLTRGANGTLTIGGLTIVGADPELAGRRVVLDGARSDAGFVVTAGMSEAALLPGSVRTLSIESYIERRDGALRLGSGFVVSGADIDVPAGRSVHAVLQARLGTDGRLTVSSLRAGGRSYGGPGRNGTSIGRRPPADHGAGPLGGPIQHRGAASGVPSGGGPENGPGAFGGPGSGFGGPGGRFGGPGPGGGGPGGGGPGGGFGGGGFGGGRH